MVFTNRETTATEPSRVKRRSGVVIAVVVAFAHSVCLNSCRIVCFSELAAKKVSCERNHDQPSISAFLLRAQSQSRCFTLYLNPIPVSFSLWMSSMIISIISIPREPILKNTLISSVDLPPNRPIRLVHRSTLSYALASRTPSGLGRLAPIVSIVIIIAA